MKVYRTAVIVCLAITVLSTASCDGRKHDAAYYMEMVDSIRKAEQVKAIHQKAGIHSDPVEAWFDTLRIHTLPILSAGAEIWKLGHFVSVPMGMNEHFGYPVSAHLKALALPSSYRRQVVLLADMKDSIAPHLMLYTMDNRHQPIDKLTLYERLKEKRSDDFGHTFTEYYISSKYEITILLYYQSHQEDRREELLNTRRYVITKDGRFEETIIEL